MKPRFILRGVKEIVDPKFKGDYDEELFTKMTELAIRCTSAKRNDRPTMKVYQNFDRSRDLISFYLNTSASFFVVYKSKLLLETYQ